MITECTIGPPAGTEISVFRAQRWTYLACAQCAYAQARKWDVFELGDRHIFMQAFALTPFSGCGYAALYHTHVLSRFCAVW